MSAPLTIPDVRKRRRHWRWLKWLALVLVLIALEETCRRVYFHRKVTRALAEALAELDEADPGWRLEEIEAAREVIPEAENSARVVMAALKFLPRRWAEESEIRELPPERLHPDSFLLLLEELRRAGPALIEARKLADMPRGRHRIEYPRNPLNSPR